MKLPTLQLKKTNRARVLTGHPWVFSGEVQKQLSDEHNGQAVFLIDAKGRALGAGIYNNQSKIVWRRFAREACAFNRDYLKSAISASIARRQEERFRRIVWSEADNIPGLVVDQFGAILVIQALTLAVENCLPDIIQVLQELLKPEEIVMRNDAPTRKHEGLELYVRTESGNPLEPDWFEIDGLYYYLDLLEGHKTGFYLDQRAQHLRIAQLAAGKKVLDGFSNQGAFALQCARAGAESVAAVDISEACTTAIKKNAAKNDLDISVETANMFDWFGEHRESKFDLIILDPPSFARNKQALQGALRGYKELNLRAMKCLVDGGILATYSCSQSIDNATFLNVLAEAAADAKRDVRLIENTGQPADHPVVLTTPESHYLKGAILKID